MRASAIYEGTVRHRRNRPKVHQFDFRFFMLLLDLDEIDTVFRWQPFWSTKRWALCRFKAQDHLKQFAASESLRDRVLAALHSNGIKKSIGPIRLLTQLSYLGYTMNPVSFFYCYSLTGNKIEAVIAEVNNTPWGEQHLYVIPADQLTSKSTIRSADVPKEFHVSPFLDLAMNYRMAFSAPEKTLAVKIENHSISKDSLDSSLCASTCKHLDVTMKLRRKELTAWSLNGLLVKYPAISFQVVAGIYWQALKLYLKKIPFVPHPNAIAKSTKDMK